MSDSAQSKMQKFLAECERYMEDRYYIYPPRQFMIRHFIMLWGGILVFAICAIWPLPIFFLPALVLVLYIYKPLFKLWGVYYSKLILFIITLAVLAGSFMIAPYIRNSLWLLLQSIR